MDYLGGLTTRRFLSTSTPAPEQNEGYLTVRNSWKRS